jgi:hypothetical protein
MQLSIQAN